RFCFAGSRLAMTMLVLAPPRTATSSFNLRRLTPVLPIAIGRPSPSHHRPLPKEAVNARRLKTAAAEIPIASDAPPRHTSRGFLVWGFFCQEVPRVANRLSFVSFFVRSQSPLLRPDPRF